MSGFAEYAKYNLKKRWKKRTPIIATYIFGVQNIFTTQIQFMGSFIDKILLFMTATTIMILIDEWVKEGHFFDPRDIGGLTHETLAILFMPILIPVAFYLRRKMVEARKTISSLDNMIRDKGKGRNR